MHTTNVRSIVVSDAESTSAPPVPPRRKKRKPKPAAIARSPLSTGLEKKPDRKRLAPPPPPPRTARRVRSRKDRPEERVSSDPVIDDAEETRNDPSSSETKDTTVQSEDTNSISTKETDNGENDTEDKDTSSSRGRSCPVFAKKEANMYPPLFFTLHDFQNVMSSTFQQEDDSKTKSSVEFATSLHESFENSLDDEENELCFRVTTTNLPFERCLDRWTATFADHFIDKFDESNRFIFDDYIDRSNKVNVRRSAGPMCYDSYEEEPSVPRLTKVRFVIESPSSSTPDHELDDEDLICDSLRNIDSLVDEEIDWHCGSSVQLIEITDDCLENLVDTEGEKNHRGSDEFGDVPLTSILKTRNDSTNWRSLEDASNIIECGIVRDDSRDSFHSSSSQNLQNEQLKIAEVGKAWLSLIKPKTECTLVLTEIRSDRTIANNEESRLEMDSLNEINENTNEIENDVEKESVLNEMNANADPKADSDEENLQDGDEKWVTSEIDDFDYKLTVNEIRTVKEDLISDEVKPEINEENDEQIREINDKLDKSTQEYKRKIFVSKSLRNMTNHQNFSSNDSEEQNSNLEEEDDDLNKTEDNRSSQECFTKAAHLEKRESITVPVDVRRNSFLENMLSKDSDQTWTNCEIVAARPKTQDTPISERKQEDKTANRLNDSIGEDPDIQQILRESKASLKKVDTSVPKITRPKMTPLSNETNPGEIKCNVLNELLSNFNNIKLKPVNVEKKITESLSQTTSSIQRNENQEEVEIPEECSRNVDNLHDEVIRETSDRIPDAKLQISSSEQGDGTTSSTLKVSNSNGYDNKIDQELPGESKIRDNSSNSLVSESELKEGSNELSGTILSRSEMIENEDLSGSSKSAMEDSVDSIGNCTDTKASVENQITGEPEVSAKPPQSEKTDVNEHEDRDQEIEEDSIVERLDLRGRRTGRGDTSAIVRRIPRSHCNNNDNNRAATPVAVSDDQSRDTVTITPGRVRSFVRYYEIRRETTIDKDSKANDKVDKDKMAGHQSVISICRGLEAKAIEARSFDARKDHVPKSATEKSLERSMKKENRTTLDRSNWSKEDTESKKQMDLSCGYVQPGKNKRKKSVKFQGGFTVIGARSPDKDGSAGNQDKRTGKGKVPDRLTPEAAIFSGKVDLQAGEELVDDDSRIEKRDAAAQIQAAAEYKECSGINRFVPKPETPRLVFYCTV